MLRASRARSAALAAAFARAAPARALAGGPVAPPPKKKNDLVPDATTLFKLTNPELMLDHRKAHSWFVVGGVIAFFSVYLAYLFATEPERPAQKPPKEDDVVRVLPNGTRVMRDGSIRR